MKQITKRILAGLVLLAGCVPSGVVQVTLSVTPISNARPCFVSKIKVFDDAGQEYRASAPDCNDAVIELGPGRSFAGVELESTQIEAISVFVD
jgi:hypothetical protein